MKNNLDSIYAKVEEKYKNANGAARIAFREVLDLICNETNATDATDEEIVHCENCEKRNSMECPRFYTPSDFNWENGYCSCGK